MSLSRRGFLAAFAATMALDPERALFVPGKKLISIPKPPVIQPGWSQAGLIRTGDIITIEGYYSFNPITRKQLAELQRFKITEVVSNSNFKFEPVRDPLLYDWHDGRQKF